MLSFLTILPQAVIRRTVLTCWIIMSVYVGSVSPSHPRKYSNVGSACLVGVWGRWGGGMGVGEGGLPKIFQSVHNSLDCGTLF